MIDGPSVLNLIKLTLLGRFDETAVKFNVKKILEQDPIDFLYWSLQVLKNCSPSILEKTTRELILLAIETIQVLEKYCNKYNWKIDKNMDGILNIYWNQNDLIAASKSNRLFESMNVPMKTLTRDECRKLEPTLENVGLVGGIYCPIDISADTHSVCREIEELLRSRGNSIQYNKKVVGYDDNELRFEDGSKEKFEKVIFCTGANFEMFDKLRHKIYWIKGHSVTWTCENQENFPKIPIFDTRAKVVITPFQNRLRIVGIAELAGLDTTIDEEKILHLKKQLKRVYPDVFDGNPVLNESIWACLRSTSSNSLPIIEKIDKNVMINLGHGHLGSTISFSSARRVVDLL